MILEFDLSSYLLFLIDSEKNLLRKVYFTLPKSISKQLNKVFVWVSILMKRPCKTL